MNIGDEVLVINPLAKHVGMKGLIIYADILADLYHVAFGYTVGATIFRGIELHVISQLKESIIGNWIFPHGKPKGCNHEYVNYTGMIEQFEYCKKCDTKKNKAS